MRLRNGRAIRSLIALFVALGFGLFTTESLIADVHDGDADTGHVASVETSGAHHDGGRIPLDGPVKAPHAAHVCHCVHAHASLTSTAQTLSVPSPTHASAPIGAVHRMASAEREPQLRPPIA